MEDIYTRQSQRPKRETEFKEEFSISQLVRMGMKDYTNSIKEFIDSDSRLSAKKIIEGMFETDEATLALIVLRTVITVLISNDKGKIMLSTLSSIVAKSVLQAKTLKQLEEQHKSLSTYIDMTYKRANEAKRIKAKRRSAIKLIAETKEQAFLSEGKNAESLGALLISILCESIDLVEIIKLDAKGRFEGVHYTEFPQFAYLVQFTEEIKYALVDLDETAQMFIKPTIMPVLEQPKPVYSWDSGDDDLKNARPRALIKMPKRKQNLKEFKHNMDKKSIMKFAPIHHRIESTSWTINEEVLDVIEQIFKGNMIDSNITMMQGEHYAFNPQLIGGLPRRYPVDAETLIQKELLGRTITTTKGFVLFADGEVEALNRYNKVKNDILAFNEANLNKALSLQSMISMAKDYKGKKFWFTYQYDTRGRLYPVQNILNPQSDKRGKALLKFIDGDVEPLNKVGEYWAKVHGANCYGWDKELLDVRVNNIDNMMEDINLIATHPLIYSEKWVNCDDPFGFLAFCFEYNKHLTIPKHPYALPVALDATCSGIQIYSGLLRDGEGAKEVNVVGQVRNDIYGKVAQVANEKLKYNDYERYITYNNSEENNVLDLKPIADSLSGKINRSITKSNTMTQPYSVTVRGMQDQLKTLFLEYESIGKKFWVGEAWEVSRLLADIHQRSIDEVVKGAKRGKEFIKAITGKVASKNKGLLYTTPMGFTVYQKNVKSAEFRIDSCIWTPNKGSQRVQFRVKRKVGRVNTHSQKNSSAPNLIHGLDTSLMHFTVEGCANKGVKSFSLIHDSYGVHPNKVPVLNVEVREAFITIFKEDVLYEWAIEVLENAGFTFKEISDIFIELDDPMLNTLNLDDVRDATFMFS